MNNVSIKKRLFFLSLMMLTIISAYSIKIAHTSYTSYIDSKETNVIVNLSVHLSAVLHELQKERGASVGFKEKNKFNDMLLSQYKLTNEKIDIFQQFSNNTKNKYKDILKDRVDFKYIRSIRKDIQSRLLSTEDIIKRYSALNKDILNIIAYLSTIPKDPQVKIHFNSFMIFIYAKEKTGIQRAIMSKVFTIDKFNKHLYEQFLSVYLEQQTLFNLFLNSTIPKIKSKFEELQKDSIFKIIEDINNIAMEKQENFGIDSIYWYKVMTTKMDKLKEFEDWTTDATIKLAHDKSVSTMNTLLLVIGISIFIFILTLFISYTIIKSISKADEELKSLLHSFSQNVIASKTDLKGKITYVSEAFCNICGYSEAELIGSPHNIIRHKDVPKSAFKDLWDTIQSGKQWTGEVLNSKKDGGYYWVDAIITPDFDSKNNIIGYSAIRHDTTAKKELEELSLNLEKKVEIRTKELLEVNTQISKSINFASLIQHTFNHKEESVNHFFNDFFIILNQRDTVGGDIVLFEKLNDDESLIMVIDCTSHGVPGAFVTMIVKTLQRQIVKELVSSKIEVNPSEILKRFNYEIKHLLDQTTQKSESNVGFDGQILYYNKATNIVKFSSARNDIIISTKDDIQRIRGDRHSVGYKDSDENFKFKEHTFNIEEDTIIYLYSDGFTDQKGGKYSIPFGNKKTLKLLEECRDMNMDMNTQKEYLLEKLKEYQNNEKQNDDISFVGLKIKGKNKND